jgi:glucose-6-phosphate dehydrogenase assembly protein OpcA
MPAVEEISRGLPVEVSKINRSLKQLWEQEEEGLTRASLINFVIYSEAMDALNVNTRLMAEITREHACRGILVAANPDASRRRVQAWISAHCHVSRAGAKQVCSEQIAFLLDGGSPGLLRSLLFSHLDSDLPLYLWWQGQFSREVDSQLLNWVDRLFFDSHNWRDPVTQMTLLRGTVKNARSRIVLCDLNWRRLIYLRLAIAQMFDHPLAATQLNHIRELEITYDPEYWTTAVLLVSWIANRLGWQLKERTDSTFTFTSDQTAIKVNLSGVPGPWVNQIGFRFEEGHLEVVWAGDFLQATVEHQTKITQMLPAGGTSLLNLVNEELIRAGEHKTYISALKHAELLW